VTGHRPHRLPTDQWPRLTRQLGEVMAELEAAHPGRRFTLLSGLAEGADRLVAHAALASGWALIAMLPFSRVRYMEDFPEPVAQAEFDALLARAETVHEAPAADAYPRAYQPLGTTEEQHQSTSDPSRTLTGNSATASRHD
jgi:hypothetical protein